MGHQYNVPTIVSIKDNKGNRIDRRQMTVLGNQSYVDLRGAPAGNLSPGDDLLIEIEFDQSLEPMTYNITGQMLSPLEYRTGHIFSTVITERHINDMLSVVFTVISDKPWHKHGSHDDSVILSYRVLPPP